MYVLQYRQLGTAEWHTIWADIHSATAARARDFLDKHRRRVDAPPESAFRILGPKGYVYYFLDRRRAP